MKPDPVDAFVKRRVQAEHHAVVAVVRKLMRELAPDSRGAEFEDKHGLLQGVGKVSKHLKLKEPKDVSKTVLRYYVKQALKHDDRD